MHNTCSLLENHLAQVCCSGFMSENKSDIDRFQLLCRINTDHFLLEQQL